LPPSRSSLSEELFFVKTPLLSCYRPSRRLLPASVNDFFPDPHVLKFESSLILFCNAPLFFFWIQSARHGSLFLAGYCPLLVANDLLVKPPLFRDCRRWGPIAERPIHVPPFTLPKFRSVFGGELVSLTLSPVFWLLLGPFPPNRRPISSPAFLCFCSSPFFY